MMFKKLLVIPIILFLLMPIIHASINDNLRAYYSFDSDCQTDDTGNGHTGTNNGATNGAYGGLNNGCDFEASDNDYVRANSVAGSWVGDGGSISLLWKMESFDDYRGVVSFSHYSGVLFNMLLYFVHTPTNKWSARVYQQSGSLINLAPSLAEQNTNTSWVHAVMTWDSDGHITKYYLNNVAQSTATANNVDLSYMDHFVIGGSDWQGIIASYFDGVIDEVGVWERELSTDEIEQLYNDGAYLNPLSLNPPVTSDYNVTSDNVVTEDNRTNWNSGLSVGVISNLLTGTFETDLESNCSISLLNLSYSDMVASDPSYKLATTETTSHSFTLAPDLVQGADCVYISCMSIANVESTGSSSGCLNVYQFTKPQAVWIPNPHNTSSLSGYNTVSWSSMFDYDEDIVYYNVSLNYEGNDSEADFLGSYLQFPLSSQSFILNVGDYDFGDYFVYITAVDYYGLHDNVSALYSFVNGSYNVTNLAPADNSSFVGFDPVTFQWITSKDAVCSLYLNDNLNFTGDSVGGVTSSHDVEFNINSSVYWSVNCSNEVEINISSSPFFFSIEESPFVAPPSYAFEVGTCPNDSLTSVAVMFLFTIIGICLLAVAFAYDVNILGVMASFFLFGVSLIIVGCSQFLGLTLVFIFSVLGVVFIIRSIV